MSTLYDKLLAKFNEKLKKTTFAGSTQKVLDPTGYVANSWELPVKEVVSTEGGAIDSISTPSATADQTIKLCGWMPSGDIPTTAEKGWGLKLNDAKTALEWGSLGGGTPTPVETGSGYTVYGNGQILQTNIARNATFLKPYSSIGSTVVSATPTYSRNAIAIGVGGKGWWYGELDGDTWGEGAFSWTTTRSSTSASIALINYICGF